MTDRLRFCEGMVSFPGLPDKPCRRTGRWHIIPYERPPKTCCSVHVTKLLNDLITSARPAQVYRINKA